MRETFLEGVVWVLPAQARGPGTSVGLANRRLSSANNMMDGAGRKTPDAQEAPGHPKQRTGRYQRAPPRAHQLRAHLPSPMAVVHCKQTPALMVLLKVVHRKNKHHIEADLLPPPVTSTSRFMPPKRTLFLAVPSPSPSCQ